MEKDNATDLSWLAFQYTLDELSPADALAFEERLADDQQAREALAEAVLLAHALERSVAPALPAGDSQRRFASSLVWAACGVAACLALVTAGRLWNHADQGVPGQTAAPVRPGRDEALAQAWFSARLPVLESELLSTDVNTDEEIGLAGGEADGRLSVPAWMLEAVQETPDAATDTEPKES